MDPFPGPLTQRLLLDPIAVHRNKFDGCFGKLAGLTLRPLQLRAGTLGSQGRADGGSRVGAVHMELVAVTGQCGGICS